jgi:TRAP-type C4-dicarboxylate transport system substrate-binding protein
MKNNIIHITLLSLLLFSAPTNAAVIKIATLSPDGTAWMVKMRHAAKEISKLTDKRVKIKFYPGGVMGDENASLRKMRINQLQGAAVSSGALTRFFKDTSLYGMPFIFNSQEEVLYVRKHMDKLIIKGLEKKGLISFGLAESGFVYLLSNNPIHSINDLQKEKFWIPDNPSARTTVESFALKPIPLPYGDVLTGLQTHLINTIISSPIASIALQWHTQVKYLTDMPVLYSWATLIISKRAMKKLRKKDQAIVHKVMSRTFKEIDIQNQNDNKAALAALKNQGINFIKPSKTQYAEWKNIALNGNKRLIEVGNNSKKMYELLQKLIATYQKNNINVITNTIK